MSKQTAPLTMQHWNSNLMCAIDVETTGLNPFFHELIQVAILPLDCNLDIRKDVPAFCINMRPDFPERTDKNALAVTRKKLKDILNTGHAPEVAKDLLMDWVEKLNLPLNKSGFNRCKIFPLGHNYSFDLQFLKQWLVDEYDDIFHGLYRDTMLSALYLNDRAGMHCERLLYPKVDLTYLCNCLKITRERSHDALQDCIATAAVYKRMVSEGLIG